MDFLHQNMQSILLASTTTTVHGVQIDPNDIIKTIESECGDIIDCVDIYKQPSLKNPLLKDHKILVLYIRLNIFIVDYYFLFTL
ncbi:Os12g0131750 [Oryza sativa Japonica Group]|uniref:Os12g0131750 protein n=1 Tax=Oryza sativa subsp. japonica TaxID=39947 RepID=A0A0P0Y6K6_ORYSJ|nr:Os12g0131750 [Oryza sativa Japonica Group]